MWSEIRCPESSELILIDDTPAKTADHSSPSDIRFASRDRSPSLGCVLSPPNADSIIASGRSLRFASAPRRWPAVSNFLISSASISKSDDISMGANVERGRTLEGRWLPSSWSNTPFKRSRKRLTPACIITYRWPSMISIRWCCAASRKPLIDLRRKACSLDRTLMLRHRVTHASKPIVFSLRFSRILPPRWSIVALSNISNAWSIMIKQVVTRPQSSGRLKISTPTMSESMAFPISNLGSRFKFRSPPQAARNSQLALHPKSASAAARGEALLRFAVHRCRRAVVRIAAAQTPQMP